MTSTSCSICIKQKKTSDPAVYCPQCNELMCQSCSDTHNQADETRNHEVMSYQDLQKLPPFILNTSMDCSKHQLKYEEYCRMHDELACKECKITFHSECEDVLKINEIVSNVKESVLFIDTFSEIEALCGNLKDIFENRNKNIIQLKICHTEIEKTIENKFDNIIEHLKKLKDRTISELNTEYTELTKDLSYTSEIIHSEEEKLTEIFDQKDSITKHATNFQTFVSLKELEKMVQEINTKLNKLSDNDKLNQYNMEFNINESIEDTFSSIQSLGDIRVTKSPSAVFIQNTGARYLEAVKEVQTPAHVQLHLQQKIDLDDDVQYYGGCYSLPGGLVVIADSGDCYNHNCKVCIYNLNGSRRSTIKFNKSDGVWDVTPVDDHHVAVTHPRSGTISIIDINKGFINKGKVVRTLNIDGVVRGLCCRGRDIVCCVEYKGLVRVNIDSGKVETVVEDKSVSYNSHVQVSNNLICYTCPYNNTVTVLDTQYNVIFTYKDKAVLRYPTGVIIDDHSNIYVTGHLSNNLVILSSDGKSCHQLLGEDDGLLHPSAVHYDRKTKTLVVVNLSRRAFIYSIG